MAQLALPAFLGSVRGTGCHPRRSKSNHKTGAFAANAAFCRLIFLQLPSSQLDMAEACGSRTQTLDSQLTANDDVAASAKFQLESIGVTTFHFHSKLSLIIRGLLPCSLLGLVSLIAEMLLVLTGRRAQVSDYRVNQD
jgi:hypothetical protein